MSGTDAGTDARRLVRHRRADAPTRGTDAPTPGTDALGSESAKALIAALVPAPPADDAQE